MKTLLYRLELYNVWDLEGNSDVGRWALNALLPSHHTTVQSTQWARKCTLRFCSHQTPGVLCRFPCWFPTWLPCSPPASTLSPSSGPAQARRGTVKPHTCRLNQRSVEFAKDLQHIFQLTFKKTSKTFWFYWQNFPKIQNFWLKVILENKSVVTRFPDKARKQGDLTTSVRLFVTVWLDPLLSELISQDKIWGWRICHHRPGAGPHRYVLLASQPIQTMQTPPAREMRPFFFSQSICLGNLAREDI